ncbi:MAG: MBL fold metallo-hydrolase [Sphingomonadales bacterium]|nr:MBL fold metallo-hydrolase [Sphingomonadales bacterium]
MRELAAACISALLLVAPTFASAKEPMKLVVLGTGTPNPDPNRSGPALAIIKDGHSYIIDAGPGLVRRAAAAEKKYGISSLSARNLETAFLTHLHTDHTVGLPDLIFTSWVLEREVPLKLFGPPGADDMVQHLHQAYKEDINIRLNGLEPATPRGYKVDVSIIHEPGVILKTGNLKVEAFRVIHGSWPHSFGYVFADGEKKIVISGDARPSPLLVKAAMGADILVHEVYSVQGYKTRPKEWQTYHASFHTSAHQLAAIAKETKPKLLVLYHQLYWGFSDKDLIQEIYDAGYTGTVISARDLDVFE